MLIGPSGGHSMDTASALGVEGDEAEEENGVVKARPRQVVATQALPQGRSMALGAPQTLRLCQLEPLAGCSAQRCLLEQPSYKKDASQYEGHQKITIEGADDILTRVPSSASVWASWRPTPHRRSVQRQEPAWAAPELAVQEPTQQSASGLT